MEQSITVEQNTAQQCRFCGNKMHNGAIKCQNCGEYYDIKYKRRGVQVKPYLFSFLFMKVFCTHCHHTGNPKIVKTGSFAIELILWIFIIPGWIYSIHRNKARYCVCSQCGSDQINKL